MCVCVCACLPVFICAYQPLKQQKGTSDTSSQTEKRCIWKRKWHAEESDREREKVTEWEKGTARKKEAEWKKVRENERGRERKKGRNRSHWKCTAAAGPLREVCMIAPQWSEHYWKAVLWVDMSSVCPQYVLSANFPTALQGTVSLWRCQALSMCNIYVHNIHTDFYWKTLKQWWM